MYAQEYETIDKIWQKWWNEEEIIVADKMRYYHCKNKIFIGKAFCEGRGFKKVISLL